MSENLLDSFCGSIQFWLLLQEREAAEACRLPLAGLDPNIDVDFGDKTAYGNTSDLIALDKLWFSMDTSKGIVVLPSDLHLGTTDPFPWDSSKGLYVMNNYHSLHCLKNIYAFARSCQSSTLEAQALEHVVHCFDVLRFDTMCTADETPLSFGFQEIIQTERAPERKCEDCDTFTKYLTENPACFRRFSLNDPRYDTLAEYMYCPPGSPYNAAVERLQAEGK